MIRRPPRSTLFPTRRSSDLTVGSPASPQGERSSRSPLPRSYRLAAPCACATAARSEEHTSELQSQSNLVCRLLLEKKKKRHDPDPRRVGVWDENPRAAHGSV